MTIERNKSQIKFATKFKLIKFIPERKIIISGIRTHYFWIESSVRGVGDLQHLAVRAGLGRTVLRIVNREGNGMVARCKGDIPERSRSTAVHEVCVDQLAGIDLIRVELGVLNRADNAQCIAFGSKVTVGVLSQFTPRSTRIGVVPFTKLGTWTSNPPAEPPSSSLSQEVNNITVMAEAAMNINFINLEFKL